jgi:hypothetical protein
MEICANRSADIQRHPFVPQFHENCLSNVLASLAVRNDAIDMPAYFSVVLLKDDRHRAIRLVSQQSKQRLVVSWSVVFQAELIP